MTKIDLPPLTPELKPLAAYVQRAQEMYTQDPVIAYWCLYHAAQTGIVLKAPTTPSRLFLGHLLDALEKLRASIGLSDAIDTESVAAAYFENFSLRVFGNADEEDRSGNATKSTPRKFMAAVSFLEVLKETFKKDDLTVSVDDKIRYAKWKAADIAKAFREGRTPNPGPANQVSTLVNQPEMPATLAENIKAPLSRSVTISNELEGTDHDASEYPYEEPPAPSPLKEDEPVIPSAPSFIPSAPLTPTTPPSPWATAYHSPPAPIPALATASSQPMEELSPNIISKVQKHCKFAVSALDFEDVEQARKELRTALELLG